MSKLVVFAMLLSACGGKILIEGGPSADSSSGPITIDGDPAPSPIPPDGSWGLWQLSSVAEPGGRDYAPPFYELDLHPDGTVYRWVCLAGTTGDGLPCPPSRRVACVTGTAALLGLAWHVELTAADGRVEGAGDIVEDPSGDIGIDGSGILPADARWHRVAAPTRERCFP